MDEKDNKRGFSGLSDLASEISDINEPIKPEAEVKPSALDQPSQSQGEPSLPKQEQKEASSHQSVKSGSRWKSGFVPGDKWILALLGLILVAYLTNNGSQSNHKEPSRTLLPSSSQNYSYPRSTPAPAVQAPISSQNSELQFTKPSVGTNNVLSIPQIRWCVREGIRIEAIRDVINTNAQVEKFNRIVNDYNSRCGSYRYRRGSKSRAERDVESYRSQIVSKAIREARQLGRSYQPSYPSVSPGVSTSTAPKKPNAQYTREAQQLLTDLGYDPGPVDGDYGRRTADAVKAFQRDAGISQDGWIDQDLLSVLRRVASQRSNSPPRVESRPAQETRRSSGIPANAWVHGSEWYCNDGYRKSGNECVKIKVPANAWVHGSEWYCNDGYQKVGDKCVSIFGQ